MKFKSLYIIALATVLLTGCKSHTTETTPLDSTQINTEGVVRQPMMGYELIAILDRLTEPSIELFKGSYNDSLLEALMPAGTTRGAINCFLAVNDAHTVLFDTGLGASKGGNLLEKLKALKIKPEEVDAICLTHLHGDHIGGMLKDGQPVFPNATVYLSVDEFDAWSDNGEMKDQNGLWTEVLSYYADHIQPFVDGDTLLGFITAHLAPGHTPGHTLFEMDGTLIVGDLFHAQDVQLQYPQFYPTYDHNPSQATASRVQWLEYAKTHHLAMAGMHLYSQIVDLDN